jgi:hypothetical protein
METLVSFFYNLNTERFILFNYHPSLALEKVRAELENIKYFFGEEAKVIISSDGYVDELVQQCDCMQYDAYVLNSDGSEVLNQAAESIQVGKFFLSKNVLKAYFKSRSREHDRRFRC